MKSLNKILLFSLILFVSFSVYSQTKGNVNFRVTTSTNNGNRKPNNVSAIWVTNSSGTYQKTLEKNAGQRVNYLYKWLTVNPSMNLTDAITGATLANYKTYNVNWNCKDKNQVVVPDGDYKLWIEFTDGDQQGPYTSFTFTKGASPVSLSPANVSKFSNISITYTPDATSIEETPVDSKLMKVYPNPFHDVVNFTFSVPIKNVEINIYDLNGKKVFNEVRDNPAKFTDGIIWNGIGLKSGIYLYTIKIENSTFVGKLIKSN